MTREKEACMKLLLKGGRVIDSASGTDQVADLAVADGRIVGWGALPADFAADRVIDAQACIVAPGLVDLAVRLREPGQEHAGMLESELKAAVAGGVTSLVCAPDTDPVLDEAGLVEMLRQRASKLRLSRVFPLGALTRGLKGEVLTEMQHLTAAGCIGFTQAEVPILNTQVLQRALQYAATQGHTVWLRPQDGHLGTGVAASGPLATRMGLAGVPAYAETIALHTLFELMRASSVKVHLCRISSAAGVALIRRAKAEGLAVTADVSIHSLHLTDADIGYFDSRARLNPVLRQHPDREALREGLRDGTIDALVSDHTPVVADAKALPFAQAEAGATGLELLWSLALKWHQDMNIDIHRTLACLTHMPATILQSGPSKSASSMGRLMVGGKADIVVLETAGHWQISHHGLRSQCKSTPFSGYELPGRVRATLIDGRVVHGATWPS
jgi:dihydroorotase